MKESDWIEIEILNWEKFNARNDIKNPWWFKFDNHFFDDPKFSDHSDTEKIIWILLLTIASREQSGKIKVKVSYVIRNTKLIDAPDVFSALEKLEQDQCLRVLANGSVRSTNGSVPRIEKRREEKKRKEKKPPYPLKSGNRYLKYVDLVISHLNQLTGKSFTPKNNMSHITARLKDGYTVDQLKQIIDNKSHDEYFASNPKLYNPATLFGSKGKVETYLNETAPNLTTTDIKKAKENKMFSDFAKEKE